MAWRVPLTDIAMPEEDVRAVMACLESGWLTMGPRTEAFERALAEYVGTPHAVAVSSGTAALHLAMLAAGIGAGDEVIVPAFTFVASAAAVRYTGAEPVLCDVHGARDFNIDPDDAARRITPRTRAIVAVHMGGYPAEVLALRALCDEHGILYVDDEVQSGCGRTGTMWAIEQLGVEPDLLVSGKTLGGGLPLAAVTGRAELMDAVHPGGLGGTFGGNPVACAAALAVLDELAAPGFRERADRVTSLLRARLDRIAEAQPLVGEVRGLGAMLALELREPTPEAAKATTAAAFEKGLLLLSCGLYGNVIRLLPPLTATDDELERGLGLLEEALGDAGAERG